MEKPDVFVNCCLIEGGNKRVFMSAYSFYKSSSPIEKLLPSTTLVPHSESL